MAMLCGEFVQLSIYFLFLEYALDVMIAMMLYITNTAAVVHYHCFHLHWLIMETDMVVHCFHFSQNLALFSFSLHCSHFID